MIRTLNTNDRAAWQSLWQGYLDFYQTDLAPGVTEKTWERLLDPAEDMHCLVAEDNDRNLIGFVNFLYHRGTWSIEDCCYLEDLYVADTARGTGSGRALIEAVYAAAEDRGTRQVYWLTHATNETARRLYDRVGRLTPFIKYQR